MVDITKLDMTDIWASSGDKTAPDPSKIATGWIVEVVPRQWWNWFENRQDQNIAYMLQKGIPEWDSFTEYLINKSYVQRNNIVYKCIQTGTNKDPATAPLYWVKAFPESSASLESIRKLTPAADRVAYFTGANSASLMTVTALARTLLDDDNVTTMRSTLGAQASNTNLTALSGATAATNTFPYWNSATTMLASPITAFGRSLIDDADAAEARTTLGLGTGAVVNVTTSATDTTAGRVLKVGDFGIGTDSQPTNIDPNTVRYGSVMGPVSQANAPSAECIIWTGARSGGARAAQFAVDHSSPAKSWIRSYNSGRVGSEWGVWVQNWDSGNTISLGLTPTTAKTALSLQNVDNTSDADKPVSTAQLTALNLKAPLASPSFTGVPATPTAAVNTSTTQVASTAFVTGQASSSAPTMNGVATTGTSLGYARADHIHPSDTSKVDKDSSTGSATLPAGTTAQRTGSPVNGMIRYNSDTNTFEGYQGGGWAVIGESGVPGAILSYAGSSIPSGYLLANGSAVSRTTYANLFSAIGTTYGVGNGSTTFNIPDLRGEFLRGLDSGRGVDSGRSLGTFQASQMSRHTHDFAGNAYGGHTHGASETAYGHNHTFSNTTNSAGAHSHRALGTSSGGSAAYMGSGSTTAICGITGANQAYYTNAGGSSNPLIEGVGDHQHTFSGTTATDNHVHTITIAAGGAFTPSGTNAGAGGTGNSSETRPRNVALQFLIKF